MDLRNIAIIAHVDHGKTTLVDQLLKQSGTFRENQQVMERAMDSNELERERGITILAKCTSVDWHGTRINIIDTPGHADFGGEVERILSMVDGVVLLVDAAEGPMPQTKFVLSKALKLGLKPIVVVNKIDRQDARAHEVHTDVFDLFAVLDANDAQLDFTTLYASGRAGWCVRDLEKDERKDLTPLFETILARVPPPSIAATGTPDHPFTMLVRVMQSDPYLGRILTGRIESGVVQANRSIKALSREGAIVERGRITKVLAFRGLHRVPVDEARAGDIVAISGLSEAGVADTLCDPEVETPIPANPIDPPTIAITIGINDSPMAGRGRERAGPRAKGSSRSKK
jgi:GTP-binding protein